MSRQFRYKAIQLPQLRSFCLAGQAKNFTTASRELNLSASTVWEQIRALERILGCTLLIRDGRSLELTAEGQVLLEIVQPHIEALDSLKRLFDAGRSKLAPRLVIASSQYLLRFHMPGPIQAFTSKFPQVELKIEVPSSSELVTVVERQQADIAICAYDPEEAHSAMLDYEKLLELPLKMLIAKTHPLARKREIALTDLLGQPVILPATGSITRRLIDRLLHRCGLADKLRVIMETPLFDATQQYAEMGIGIGLMHLQVSPRQLPGIQVRLVEESQVPLSIGMVVRKHGHLPQHVRDFQEIVRQQLESTPRED